MAAIAEKPAWIAASFAVLPRTLMEGSAPFARSNRAISWAPYEAAKYNGVKPSIFVSTPTPFERSNSPRTGASLTAQR